MPSLQVSRQAEYVRVYRQMCTSVLTLLTIIHCRRLPRGAFRGDGAAVSICTVVLVNQVN
jgi:hypothetical protein